MITHYDAWCIDQRTNNCAGGPTASVIAFRNPDVRVTVVDKDETRIRRWNSNHLPIYEPGLDDIVRVARDGLRGCIASSTPVRVEDPLDMVSDALVSSAESGSHPVAHGEELADDAPRKPNLFFTTDMAKSISEADIVFIAVNTPTKARGSGAGAATDMTAFEAVTVVVAKYARPGAIIVEKSTVPCRTSQLVESTVSQAFPMPSNYTTFGESNRWHQLELHRPGVRFDVLNNPEFLAAGTAINDLLMPDRVLIGSSPTLAGYQAANTLASVYAAWIPRSRIITTNVFSSELAKLVANSMLAQRISSINSIAAICQATGADVDEVATATGADPRIGHRFLRAGIGFGGSCFKKDLLSLVYLAESLDLPEVGAYWRSVVTMNEFARNRFTSRVIKCLNNTLRGKKVAILGYAFKKDTNDTRESPALEIIRTLLDEDPREVSVFDPCCIPASIEDEVEGFLGYNGPVLKRDGGPVAAYANVYQACMECDAIVVTTDADEFSTSVITSPKMAAEKAIPRVAPSKHIERVEPTDTELLALHRCLVRSLPPTRPVVERPSCISPDIFDRLQTAPTCIESCPDCDRKKSLGQAGGLGPGEHHQTLVVVDWAKISYHMHMPRWVFDGRGVLDIRKMGELGFRVETVGRQGGC